MAEDPPAIEPIDYVKRWRDIVERRRIQMDAAYAQAGTSSADYWAKRAKTYRQALHDRTISDPFYLRVRADVGPETDVLDVGAGTGRHTLSLAPVVRRVTAVDPSAAMLSFLRTDLQDQRITNVGVVEGDWLEVNVEPADVVICSHVLYPIADVVPFVERLAAHARKRVFVYLRVDPLPTDMGLWPEFHGHALQAQPSALDLLNLLAQIGTVASYEVVQHRFGWTFANKDEAVDQLANTLCLREDDAVNRTRLSALLDEILVELDDGRLGQRVGPARSAIISWSAR
jgi:SAM-dependent methyltransferase